jgi:hypothetical protein
VKSWMRHLLLLAVGFVSGVGFAVDTVRAGALSSRVVIGPWKTGTDFGTAEAGARTRAVVALRGLLALPAREARYYTASQDGAGQPLDGRCSYKVIGGLLPGHWWSLTLYDDAGYLVPNATGIYSVEGAALAPSERSAWTIMVSPQPRAGHWLPTGGLAHIALTLRTYLPPNGGTTNPARASLPSITKVQCS